MQTLDDGKIALIIGELQEIQSGYHEDSSISRWINKANEFLDGAMCAIRIEKERENEPRK